jgi:hypothetical protein
MGALMKTTEVEIRFNWPVSNRYSDNRARLEITDRRSGSVILEAELLAEDFASLMANRGANVSASLLGDDHYDKVGKYIIAESIPVPPDIHARYSATKPGEKATEWAHDYAAANNWDSHYLSQHNNGWFLHVSRYVDEPPPSRW